MRSMLAQPLTPSLRVPIGSATLPTAATESKVTVPTIEVAYLVNQYPKTSHTFIRREIAALEDLGTQVARFTMRTSPEGLVDPADFAEAKRTLSIVGQGALHAVFTVFFVALRNPKRFFEAFSLTVRTGRRSDRGLLYQLIYFVEACVLADWLRKKPQIAHLHAHFGTNSATVAMLCRVLGGPPFSFTVHGPEEFDKPEALALAEKIRRSAFTVGISSFGRSQLMRLVTPEHWSKIEVVRCGLDAAFLDEEPPPVPDNRVLVSVARLSSQKGQALLVEAARILRDRGVEFELLLVGDGELRAQIEQQIRAYKLEQQVKITGWQPSEAVKRAVRSGRGFVLPSFAEGLPIVLMEALAQARPVITTWVAGIPELVQDGRHGFLVPAGAVEPLAAAMERMLETPTTRLTEMGREGRWRVLELHDARRSSARLQELFARSAA